jgi:PST family polysaccharide transporter
MKREKLATDAGGDPERDLTTKALGGASTSIAGRIIGLLASFAALSILARLLTPEDYGTYSIIMLVSGLAALIPQALGNAITQETAIDPDQTAGAFTVVAISSLVLAVVFFMGFGVVVRLYPSFNLAPYAVALCALIPLTSVTTYFDAVQARQFKFKTVALIELFSSNLLQAAVSIALAFAGWGAWSLLLGFLAAAFVKLLAQLATGMLAFAKLRSIHSRIQHASGWFFAIGIVNYVGRNGDNAIVGYLLGPAALGLYSRAFNLMMRPVTTLGGTVMSVFYPMLSSIGHDTVRVRSGYLKALNLTALLCFPPSAFAYIYGDEIILFLFGHQWVEVAAPFKILIGALYFRLAYRVTETVAFSKKALLGAMLRQTIYGGTVVLGSLIGSRWGIAGIAAGVTAALVFFFLLSASFANRLVHATVRDFVRAHTPALIITAAVAIVMILLRNYLVGRFSSTPSLLIGSASFAALYASLILFGPSSLFRGSALEAMRASFKKRWI